MDTKAKNNYNEEEVIKWGGWLNELLWVCAGVNRKVLRQCPTDYAKYAGIGGTILFTSLMAMLSGGYALFTVFNTQWMAIAFGIFWGTLIFNLDRFIVNTMYSDGKVSISWLELRNGLPRIIMAIFLGFVISTPLEMKIFEDRIESQLVKDNQERANQTLSVISERNKSLEVRRDVLENEKRDIERRLSEAEDELKKEGEGSALSGKIGHGPIYKDKERNRDAIESELNRWESLHGKELETIISQITENQAKARMDVEKGNTENGFCSRYEAFSNIKKENGSIRIVSLFILLLFIIIETAPTFFKMMIASGPYDDYLRAEMHKVRVLSDKRIAELNDEFETEIQINTQKNKERLEAEVLANKELMEKLAAAQADLLQTAIDEWKEQETIKIKEDPSKYIKTNVN